MTSYARIYKYLCNLTHCDINTIGYYQEDSHHSYKGSSREALMSSLLWNVYLNCKFYQVLQDGELLDSDVLNDKVTNTFFGQSLILKEIFAVEVLKAELYAKSIEDEDMRRELYKYIDDLNILRDEI